MALQQTSIEPGWAEKYMKHPLVVTREDITHFCRSVFDVWMIEDGIRRGHIKVVEKREDTKC